MSQIEELLKLQKNAIAELQSKTSTFARDGAEKKNVPYYERRLVRLDDWYQSFKYRNEELEKLKEANPTQPYFTNNSYSSSKNLYKVHKKELREGLQALTGENYDDTMNLDESLVNNETNSKNAATVSDSNGSNAAVSNSNAGNAVVNDSVNPVETTLLILNVLRDDVSELLTSVNLMTGNESPGLAEANLDLLRESWSAFKNKYVEAKSKNLHLSFDMRSMQKAYAGAVGELNDMIKKREPTKNVGSYELPKIKLPEFHGKDNEWRGFIDLFDKIIHNNTALGDDMKMQYLKTCLRGTPASHVAHLPPTAESYKACRELLAKRYDNKREQVGKYIDAILNLPLSKTENSDHLRKIHDTANESILAIKNLYETNDGEGEIMNVTGQKLDELVIIHILLKKLSQGTIMHYECQLANNRETESLSEFLTYLEKRAAAVKSAEKQSGSKPMVKFEKQSFGQSKENLKCVLCNDEHYIAKCSKFTQKSVPDRINFIKTKGLCINCLSSHKDECRSKFSCKTCSKKHHSLLHLESKLTKTKSNEQTTSVSANTSTAHSAVILATAIVSIESFSGEKLAFRALIDQGSESSFISTNAVQLLRLRKIPMKFEISGVGEQTITSKFAVNIKVSPRFSSSFVLKTRAIVLDKLAKITGATHPIARSFDHICNLHLADPSFHENTPIDLMLGAAEYAQIIQSGVVKGALSEPIAQNSELGWIVSGPSNVPVKNESQIKITALVSNVQLNESLKKFFDSENMGDVEENPLSEEEIYCEEHYCKHTFRNDDGQYVVSMPFKGQRETPDLGDSRKCAIATLFQLERRFKSNPQLASEYKKFIHEYIELGHMEPVEYDPSIQICYLPHHCVMKESTTTKLRVVYNASQKTANGKSLNDNLAVGALAQNDMLNIVLNFRVFEIAFTADIEKMYRQILIHENQRDLQRIVWRDSPEDPIQDFRLKTVTYGTSPAPSLATRTLKQLSCDVRDECPIAADIIANSMYMDDVARSIASEEDAIGAYHELKRVFASAGMNLRKWCTNSSKLRALIPESELELKACSENVKMLGISWCATTDQFTYNLKINVHSNQLTKRMLFSEILSLYDPLGWISPVMVAAKNLMQLCWIEGINWDDNITPEISTKWIEIRNELQLLNNITIPRWINYSPGDTHELHGFCDASKMAYAAVIYLKNTTKNTISLVVAKTKVAPKKETEKVLTNPQRELCGAALLAKLARKTIDSWKIPLNGIFMWSDCKIVIDWINGNPKKYVAFVANRTTLIKKCISSEHWHHVAGENNPADCASRGITPSKLINHSLWWTGPQFLKENNYPIHVTHTLVSANTAELIKTITDKYEFLPQLSSFYRMKRVIAICMRFYRQFKLKTKVRGPITADELDTAELIIIKNVQNESFQNEIVSLTHDKLSKNCTIVGLSPFLDANNILRVGGRLNKSNLPYDSKHQILLPKTHFVTKLIIVAAHIKCLHGGPRLTEAVLRQRFWVINSQLTIRTVLKTCTRCVRFHPKVMSQIMADLPASRVELSVKPFTRCAVDYTGAINYKLAGGRGGRTSKAYVAVFVCMTTKAIHLEAVTAMTADAFIAAYRRMAARRGVVKDFYSDNGTNFVRANKELAHLSDKEVEEFLLEVANELAKNGTKWHFSPAGGPHHNGLAEAGVKTIKSHLIKVIGQVALTFEELATLLYQIEACANSRPLCRLSANPNDAQILTPGHFLVGAPLLAPPDENLLETKANWLNRWQLVQKLSQTFWNRFRDEYLNTLQRKAKWHLKEEQPQKDDIVLIKDENTPSCTWPLARIVDVHPGDDNLVRVVSVKFRDNVFKRPITKIAPLPKPEIESSKKVSANISKITSKPKNRSYNVLPILIAFLATAALLATPAKAQPYTITRFDSTPGLYFEQKTIAQMSFTNWRTIVFVDLLSFQNDRAAIKTNIESMKTLCDEKLHDLGTCEPMCRMVEDRFSQVVEKTKLLLTQHKGRSKRAVLPFVGDIAEILFGVLGPTSAEKYVQDIRKLTINDEHVMLLLQNQTSVLEATTNILKKHDEHIAEETKQINALSALIKKNVDTNQASLVFQTIATFVLHTISEHERQLDALLDIIIDATVNRVNFNLITPAQMKAQSNVIEEHAPKNLVTPEVLNMFKLAKITPFATTQTIFFQVSIPLLKPEKFQIFKIFQVPFMRDTTPVQIKSEHKFIITSIDRQSYQFLSHAQFKSCNQIAAKNVVCFHPKNWHTHAVSTCEWNLLTHQSNNDCVTEPAVASEWWQELDEANKWLFFVPSTTLTAICGESVSHHELLPGSGVLELSQNCTIRDNFKTIEPQLDLDNINNEFIFPRLSNVSIHVMEHEEEHGKKLDYFRTNFSRLEEQLSHLHSKTLNTPNENLTHHDIHQYTVAYGALCLLIVLIMCLFYMWRHFNAKFQIRRQPIPAPRMHRVPPADLAPRAHMISMPNLNCNAESLSE